ncbi:hypothetical protein SNOG_02072 [Parastagonospora nodorum SN15]|uniref:Uncharacterized protein n=1 Tax=Phaeosphaeria nodorum (strain SN15 / ATCC MYA-4574 / FGSC 10173) TaxID=321614 RepID=Q0V1P2_PHANO|nr:hypothetical protein SNOG_02072 [Parastagonospora nodorum SN15]EAT90284.2 hypothetical protein SNOG_02072 [Parastagonospora nodorum SN15]
MYGWLNEKQDVAQQIKEAEDRRATISTPRWAYLQARKKGEDHGLVVEKIRHLESEAAVLAQPSTPLTPGYLSKQTLVAESLDERPPQVGQSLRNLFVQASNRRGSQRARFRSSAESDQEALQDQTKCRREPTHPNVSTTQHDVQYKYIPPSPYTRCTYGLARVYPSVDRNTHINGRVAPTDLPQAGFVPAYTSYESKPYNIYAKFEANKPRKRECQLMPIPAQLQQEVADEDTESRSSTNTSPVLAPNPTPIELDFDIDATVPLLPSSDPPLDEQYPQDAELDFEVVSYEGTSSSADSEDDFAFDYEVVDADSRPSSSLSVSSGLQ